VLTFHACKFPSAEPDIKKASITYNHNILHTHEIHIWPLLHLAKGSVCYHQEIKPQQRRNKHLGQRPEKETPSPNKERKGIFTECISLYSTFGNNYIPDRTYCPSGVNVASIVVFGEGSKLNPHRCTKAKFLSKIYPVN